MNLGPRLTLRCAGLWLVVVGIGPLHVDSAQARVLVPPMAAAMVRVCGGQPCLAALPKATKPQSKSLKRPTRRST
ncbi:MAG: hypothetical protein Q7U99_27805 [Rubrivivax sp.]|nr:hypothetical protein [Rubrivivax sp.]